MKTVLIAIPVICFSVSLCSAAIINNGDFETGDLTGWTTFTTANGDLGSASGYPTITTFNVNAGLPASDAATFMVGEKVYNSATGHTSQGGGIYQTFNASPGIYFVGADFAAWNNTIGSINDTAGIATVILDGATIETLDFKQLLGGGNIGPGQMERGSFLSTYSLGAGLHQITIQFTRNWLNGGTPLEFVDNIQVTPVPEPSAIALSAVGLAIFGLRKARSRTRIAD